MPDYAWPKMDSRRQMGRRISRLDGIPKATGAARYPSDQNPPNLLHAALLTCPHAHAFLKSIDISEAKAMPGVTAIEVIWPPGRELQWQGAEIAAVAATTEEIARDAVRKIKVEFDVQPHLVREDDLGKAGNRAKPAGEQIDGDPDKAFQEADAVTAGDYNIAVLTHCCLEPHGQVIAWGDKLEYWPSTQSVSTIANDLGNSLKIPATDIHVNMDYMGGGFGSKFPADLWGAVCAKLSKASGGRPVKLFLDRATELQIAGCRPSIFSKVKVGAKKDGTITAWQSETWATGGVGGGGVGADLLPYVHRKVPNRRINHTSVSLNAGSARAWRAPNHPQLSYITCSAFEDMAAKLGISSLDLFLKNADYTNRPEVYRRQLNKAAELAEWKKHWHPRGDKTAGPVKRGLGIGVNSWGGLGHQSQVRTTIQPDGGVLLECGTQDLGVGTRTVIAQVAAESLGLPLNAVTVRIGDNRYPASGPSGGSTTVGGVSAATRKSSLNALDKLFQAVAASLGAPAEQLEAADGRIQVKGTPAKSLTWKQACAKLGTMPVSETGDSNVRRWREEGLMNQGAAGVQIADVSVDVETGVVTMNRIVAVQDCGLIVNPKLTESQVYGACIMNVCGALYEERVLDQQTGRWLNADMEFYKLAGLGDIGEILVHLEIDEENDKRGVIGIGEPPTVGTIAAIANAVANAIGVRVNMVPLTPHRVLGALAGRKA
jgi:xanthine dehydrogenase YagR molybdenum-binding subunit